MKKHILRPSALGLFFMLSAVSIVSAQTEHRGLIDGNKYYFNKNYEKATAEYEKVLQQNKSSLKAQYNLGNALFEKKDYDKAIEHYKSAAQLAEDEKDKASAYHNLGNAYFKKEKYEEAVDAYKSSLRVNSTDLETKHNLAQAMRIIRQNQPPPPKENENKDKENENPPPPPEEKENDDIDRMMDVIDNEDKKTQKNKKTPPSKRRPPAKDW
jgi:Ca-activated chloride channel family protein